jgi:hypothetical protein
MTTFTFSGPGDGLVGGPTTVQADDETEARHLAMVKRWGPPSGKPAQDADERGRYYSAGLDLIKVE